MKRLLTLSFTIISGFSYGQTLSGNISNENGDPLEDVGVFNKTTGGHTHTNATGSFSLKEVSLKDSIYFSILGFKTKLQIIDEKMQNKSVSIIMETSSINLDQVVLFSEVNSLSRVMGIDIKTNPVKSSQEILTKMPGLIIGQHAGGGKAEQIFLRGFDADHGTDVAISVDGMPVNMVSHAHGQGYSDLHFVIPETIENIDFGKGPYYASQGDFNTAGYVDLRLKKTLKKNYFSLEGGQFNTKRLMGMFKILESDKSNAYVASEVYLTDGPFDSPQNFNRINILGRYNFNISDEQELNLTASHFQSKWDASGQIPQRAVDEGIIDRFGAIDDTEGGETSRTNIVVNHLKILDADRSLKTKSYVSQYNFELYSNFTFYLLDPVNGDQIRQKENRLITGAESVLKRKNIEMGDTRFMYEVGGGFRYDSVDNLELSYTVNRITTLEPISLGDVGEVNGYGFLNTEFKMGNWILNPALRLDYFQFDYENKLSPVYDRRSESKVAVSPKLNAVLSVTPNWQMYLKTGIGFHSNDTRVVVTNSGEDILPAAYGADLGAIFKPLDNLVVNTALWGLYLQQEFIYVGDEGIVEPGDKTRRLGIDLGARYQTLDWLYLFADINYSYGRSTEEPKGQNYIPLAPDLTSSGGIIFDGLKGFSGGLTYRYVSDRPANEDGSITAKGYFVNDFNVSYSLKDWTFGIIVENLLNTEWNETQFATESRLYDEPSPVEEIDFTPGYPFYIRGKLTVSF